MVLLYPKQPGNVNHPDCVLLFPGPRLCAPSPRLHAPPGRLDNRSTPFLVSWVFATEYRSPGPIYAAFLATSRGLAAPLHTTKNDLRLERLLELRHLFNRPHSTNKLGGGVPSQYACTLAHKKSNTERPVSAHVANTVQIRSLQRLPFSLRVPCVM